MKRETEEPVARVETVVLLDSLEVLVDPVLRDPKDKEELP